MKKYKKTFQLGVRWKNDEGVVCKTVGDYHGGLRVCDLRESNFVGLFDGMHYYARLFVSTPWFVEAGKPDSQHHGYGGKAMPGFECISLDATRILTVVEYDALGRALGKPGEATTRFNSAASARAAAVELFQKRFGKGWVLKTEEGGIVSQT